jgi:hypothetical protein
MRCKEDNWKDVFLSLFIGFFLVVVAELRSEVEIVNITCPVA